jgi:NADH-quinone oxidoreductase subunit J
MVLYLFVVAYVGGADDPIRPAGSPGLRWLSGLFALVLFVELSIAVLGSGLSALSEEGAGWFEAYGTPAEIGRLLLTDFLLAFEIASILLLVAAVGAVVLARRRSGLEDPRELSVADLFRDREIKGTQTDAERGTMLEAGGEPRR